MGWDERGIPNTTFLKYIDEVLIDIGTSVNCSLLILILSNVSCYRINSVNNRCGDIKQECGTWCLLAL